MIYTIRHKELLLATIRMHGVVPLASMEAGGSGNTAFRTETEAMEAALRMPGFTVVGLSTTWDRCAECHHDIGLEHRHFPGTLPAVITDPYVKTCFMPAVAVGWNNLFRLSGKYPGGRVVAFAGSSVLATLKAASEWSQTVYGFPRWVYAVEADFHDDTDRSAYPRTLLRPATALHVNQLAGEVARVSLANMGGFAFDCRVLAYRSVKLGSNILLTPREPSGG